MARAAHRIAGGPLRRSGPHRRARRSRGPRRLVQRDGGSLEATERRRLQLGRRCRPPSCARRSRRWTATSRGSRTASVQRGRTPGDCSASETARLTRLGPTCPSCGAPRSTSSSSPASRGRPGVAVEVAERFAPQAQAGGRADRGAPGRRDDAGDRDRIAQSWATTCPTPAPRPRAVRGRACRGPALPRRGPPVRRRRGPGCSPVSRPTVFERSTTGSTPPGAARRAAPGSGGSRRPRPRGGDGRQRLGRERGCRQGHDIPSRAACRLTPGRALDRILTRACGPHDDTVRRAADALVIRQASPPERGERPHPRSGERPHRPSQRNPQHDDRLVDGLRGLGLDGRLGARPDHRGVVARARAP